MKILMVVEDTEGTHVKIKKNKHFKGEDFELFIGDVLQVGSSGEFIRIEGFGDGFIVIDKGVKSFQSSTLRSGEYLFPSPMGKWKGEDGDTDFDEFIIKPEDYYENIWKKFKQNRLDKTKPND